ILDDPEPAAAAARIGYRYGNHSAREETVMDKAPFARRDILKLAAAAGTTSLVTGSMVPAGAAQAAGAPAYDPGARFDLAVNEVELRRNSAGRMLMARI